MIDKATVDRIYMTADIVDVIGDFVTLQKKGTNYQACCPFHNEKTPSFIVSPAKGLYKCFGCGKGGNAVSFVMEHESMSYVEALKYVAKKYGIEVKEKEYTPAEQQERDEIESLMLVSDYANNYFIDKLHNSGEGKNVGMTYFRERGFTDATIEKFQLGFCPSKGDAFSITALDRGYKEAFLVETGLTIKREQGGYYDRFCGRVMFPIHSLSGRVIGFGGRIMTSDKNKAKYLNSPESKIYHKSNTLYGIFFAKKAITHEDRCILVEGYTDVISMHQSGIENVVASSGTSLTQEQIVLISRFTKNVTVIYDGDSAGIKASLRGIDMILKEGLNVRVVLLPDGEDPDSFARSHTAAETNDYILEHEEDFISFKTKLLLGEVEDDPIARATVINDVIESIAVIGSEVVRSQYIRRCGKLLDVDEEIISREVQRKRISVVSGKEGVRIFDNGIRREQFLKRKEKEEKAVPEGRHAGRDIEEVEKELITYLLKNGNDNFVFDQSEGDPVELNIAETILEELEIDNIKFQNPAYQTIFEEYGAFFRAALEEEERDPAVLQDPNRQRVSINRFINHPNKDICNLVVDILTSDEQYRQSKIWSKYIKAAPKGTKNEHLDAAIPKSIALYKLRIIELVKASLLLELKKDKNNLEILQHINTLNDNRKKICKKYMRIL